MKSALILGGIYICLGRNLRAQTSGEAALTYLGNDRPSEAQPGWQQDAQGIAHDSESWFITQRYAIWKLPGSQDLATEVRPFPGVNYRAIMDYPDLWLRGYNHFGDPEVSSFNGEDYLFVPVTAYDYSGPPPSPPGVLAVFRARDLSYVTKGPVPAGTSGESWCAFDTDGKLCLPEVDVAGVMRAVRLYNVDSEALREGRLSLILDSVLPLLSESDSALEFTYLQGGAISPSEGLLYIVAGGVRGWFDEEPAGYGIEVFERSAPPANSWHRIKRSSNGVIRYVPPNGFSMFPVHGRFDYQFDDFGYPQSAQEPEGLTFWDLDRGGRPARGQLHVMLVDHGLPGEDEVSVKHYTSSIFVDIAWAAISADPDWSGIENGTSAFPFGTIAQANDEATNGADLRIKTGTYPETITFSKRVRIVADGGPVTIGP